MSISQTHDNGPARRAPGTRLPFAKSTLFALSVASGAMLGLAMPNLVNGSGLMVGVKSVLLAGSATLVSYAVNRFANERGAPLAAVGYLSAGIVSAASIIVVGSGLFAATYAGLTYRDVEQLRLEAHGTALSEFAARTSDTVSKAGRIAPAMSAITSDLDQKRACEIASSCVSGRGNGGRGPVARAIMDKADRAEALAAQIIQGEGKRVELQEKLNGHLADYHQIEADASLSHHDKRLALQELDLSIKQVIGELEEVLPVALLRAYANELGHVASIQGRPEASKTLSAILAGHGKALGEVLDGITGNETPAPIFPKKTGVSDTFAYLAHFVPIAAIAGVVELVFPISLWLYTLFALSWAKYQIEPPVRRSEHDDDIAMRDLLPGPEHIMAHHARRKNERDRSPKLNGRSAASETDQPHVERWPNR